MPREETIATGVTGKVTVQLAAVANVDFELTRARSPTSSRRLHTSTSVIQRRHREIIDAASEKAHVTRTPESCL